MLTLPDVVAPGLDVIFCAPAVGECAALRGHYYAGPGNLFWRLLHESGFTPDRLQPSDDDSLPAYGIGLVDVVRTSPPGQRPERFDVAAFTETIPSQYPARLAFNGKHAASVVARDLGHRDPALGRVAWLVAGVPVFVLPSSSGANQRREYDGRGTRLEWWSELSQLVHRPSQRSRSSVRGSISSARW